MYIELFERLQRIFSGEGLDESSIQAAASYFVPIIQHCMYLLEQEGNEKTHSQAIKSINTFLGTLNKNMNELVGKNLDNKLDRVICLMPPTGNNSVSAYEYKYGDVFTEKGKVLRGKLLAFSFTLDDVGLKVEKVGKTVNLLFDFQLLLQSNTR